MKHKEFIFRNLCGKHSWGRINCPSYISPYNYRHNAFTLIELLVVISIIALLLGILLPSLNKARQQAKKLVCSSNMRQTGIALTIYLLDNDDHLPDSSCHISDPNKYWIKILSKYTGEELLFRCPSDKAKNFIDWNKPLSEQPKDLRWFGLRLTLCLTPDVPDMAADTMWPGLFANLNIASMLPKVLHHGLLLTTCIRNSGSAIFNLQRDKLHGTVTPENQITFS